MIHIKKIFNKRLLTKQYKQIHVHPPDNLNTSEFLKIHNPSKFTQKKMNNCPVTTTVGSPGGVNGKEPTCQRRRPGFNPWVGKIPWRREWQHTPGFLPGESYGWRRLAGYSPWGYKEPDMTERLIQEQSTKGIRLIAKYFGLKRKKNPPNLDAFTANFYQIFKGKKKISLLYKDCQKQKEGKYLSAHDVKDFGIFAVNEVLPRVSCAVMS